MKQTIIKECAPYDLNVAMCSDAMGPNHQARISMATARALCGMYPLTKMGYETVCAVAPGHRLVVQNISGHYYVACCSAKVDAWPVIFRVTLVRAITDEDRRAACEASGYELHETSDPNQPIRFYWQHRDAEPHQHGAAFNTEVEMWDDCYKRNVKGTKQ